MITFVSTLEDLELGKNNTFSMVVYSATWCKPCQLLKSWVKEHYENVSVFVVDIDDPDMESVCENVKGLPTIEFYKSGEKTFHIEGFKPNELKNELDIVLQLNYKQEDDTDADDNDDA